MSVEDVGVEREGGCATTDTEPVGVMAVGQDGRCGTHERCTEALCL